VKPIVVGKPHPFLIEQALEYLGTARHETIMIGDQVATDIAAGNAAGLRSILLASDVPFNAATGVVPDRIVSSLLEWCSASIRRSTTPSCEPLYGPPWPEQRSLRPILTSSRPCTMDMTLASAC
jgi:4-nitrophenyl phosphatase